MSCSGYLKGCPRSGLSSAHQIMVVRRRNPFLFKKCQPPHLSRDLDAGSLDCFPSILVLIWAEFKRAEVRKNYFSTLLKSTKIDYLVDFFFFFEFGPK